MVILKNFIHTPNLTSNFETHKNVSVNFLLHLYISRYIPYLYTHKVCRKSKDTLIFRPIPFNHIPSHPSIHPSIPSNSRFVLGRVNVNWTTEGTLWVWSENQKRLFFRLNSIKNNRTGDKFRLKLFSIFNCKYRF